MVGDEREREREYRGASFSRGAQDECNVSQWLTTLFACRVLICNHPVISSKFGPSLILVEPSNSPTVSSAFTQGSTGHTKAPTGPQAIQPFNSGESIDTLCAEQYLSYYLTHVSGVTMSGSFPGMYDFLRFLALIPQQLVTSLFSCRLLNLNCRGVSIDL